MKFVYLFYFRKCLVNLQSHEDAFDMGRARDTDCKDQVVYMLFHTGNGVLLLRGVVLK